MELLKEASDDLGELGRMPNSTLSTCVNSRVETTSLFKSNMHMYAITIKPTHKLMIYKCNNNKQFFENKIFEMLANYRLVLFNYVYEYDSLGKIHAHMTVGSFDPNLSFTIKGWHIFIKVKYNENWENYMNKDYRIEDFQNSKYYETKYGFIDAEHDGIVLDPDSNNVATKIVRKRYSSKRKLQKIKRIIDGVY